MSVLARAGVRPRPGVAVAAAVTVLAALALGPLVAGAAAGFTERVSVGPNGAQAYRMSDDPSISADGRSVAFVSDASNLVAGDTNGTSDVFVRDRQTGSTERVSVATDGAQANGRSWTLAPGTGSGPALSADGRFVAFISEAWNLVAGDTNGIDDVFVHDRQSGSTERVSVATDGAQANGRSWRPALSADGRFVAFSSHASNLVAGDTNGTLDVFVHDRQSGSTERVSVGPNDAQAYRWSDEPSISADGRFVAFVSGLFSGANVFVRDRQTGSTERVSAGWTPALSSDGRFLAFVSDASNLVAGDTNGTSDVFVHDRQSGSTERVSVATGGAQTDWYSAHADISADGRFIAFASPATTLVAGDTKPGWDVFVRDRQSGSTERVSVGPDGAQANGISWLAALSADGRFVAFSSEASNLVVADTNRFTDVFVHDRESDGCTITGTDGDDVLAGTPGQDVICGLAGNDQLRGGDRHDVLHGGYGDDRLSGASGRDWLVGGFGNDTVFGGAGADRLGGGPGVDRATYWGHTTPVIATLGDGANDGAAGEGDDIGADIENLSGGSGDDTLTGNGADNRLSGRGGNDRLIGGGGHDLLLGGDGDDSHDANDGVRDSVICGPGTDSVLRDPLDWLSHTCENR